MTFIVLDVLLLRLPQCLWAWAFMLMAVVWQDIAAAAAGGTVSDAFRCGMNGMGVLLMTFEVALTCVASPLLSSDEPVALLLYNVGDGVLAVVIVALTVAGGRAVWAVLGILNGYSAAGDGDKPAGCGRGGCRALCTPVAASGAAGDEEGTYAAVYEALRQATVAMVITGFLAVALVADVAVEASLQLSTERTPRPYAWFLGIFLFVEAAGAILLGLMTWPRSAAQHGVAGSPV